MKDIKPTVANMIDLLESFVSQLREAERRAENERMDLKNRIEDLEAENAKLRGEVSDFDGLGIPFEKQFPPNPY